MFRNRSAAAICGISLLVAACGASSAPSASHPSSASVTQAPATQPGQSAVSSPAVSSASASPTPVPQAVVDRLQFVLLAQRDRAVLLNSGDNNLLGDVPAGLPSPDWRVLYSSVAAGSDTGVRRISVEDGNTEITWRVPGSWQLATVGQAHAPAGLSADGGTLVLQETRPTAGTTQFAVVDVASRGFQKVISLHGQFAFDALSTDGSRLYVIEAKSAGSAGTPEYAVRSVDVPTGTLEDGIVVDKTQASEVMAGIPIQQLRGPNGQYLTLYQGPEHPFIHVLGTDDRTAFCIDLPSDWGRHDDTAAAWGMAIDQAGQTLYVANGMLGRVAEIDLASLALKRAASYAPAAVITTAKFASGAAGQAGTNVVVDASAKRVYIGDANGILALSTGDLRERARLAVGTSVVSLGLSADGTTLFAVASNGSAYVVDAASGDVLGTLAGSGYTQVLRVVRPG